MKGHFVFSLALATVLTVVASGACFLLNLIYVNWLQVPIEMLAVLVFTFEVALCIFILSIAYAVTAKYFLERKRTIIGFRHFLIIFTCGALAVILTLAIIFPCDAKPFFVGGYLIEKWFGG